jgi:phosphate uptake regulator
VTLQEIQALHDSGKQVTAIKALRELTKCGLREAHEALTNRKLHTLPAWADVEKRRKLEAAAPDLLAALTEALSSFKCTQSPEIYPVDHWCNKAIAAIAKATV